jgi:DNA-binding MarR family transcriptional regulator
MKDYEELLVALRQITRAIDLHSRQLLRDTGLTTSQLLILQNIAKHQHATPTAIARDIHLSQATVTNVIARLESNGLVSREKSAGDRRSTEVRLTEAGTEKIASAPEPLQADFLENFRKLEPWEAHMMLSSLQRLAAMMNAEGIDASPILAVGEIVGGSGGKG